MVAGLLVLSQQRLQAKSRRPPQHGSERREHPQGTWVPCAKGNGCTAQQDQSRLSLRLIQTSGSFSWNLSSWLPGMVMTQKPFTWWWRGDSPGLRVQKSECDIPKTPRLPDSVFFLAKIKLGLEILYNPQFPNDSSIYAFNFNLMWLVPHNFQIIFTHIVLLDSQNDPVWEAPLVWLLTFFKGGKPRPRGNWICLGWTEGSDVSRLKAQVFLPCVLSTSLYLL